MDAIRPGRGIADVLPEALKAAGAQGVVLNHSERPMTLNAIRKTIDRANELDLLTFVCADTIMEAQALALLHPNILNPEPTELIGSGNVSDMDYVREIIRAVKSIDESILVEYAAGITTAQQVYDFIMAGFEAVGSASGILTSANPHALLNEMIGSVSRAREDLARQHR
jgi:triosephosphate isomerase